MARVKQGVHGHGQDKLSKKMSARVADLERRMKLREVSTRKAEVRSAIANERTHLPREYPPLVGRTAPQRDPRPATSKPCEKTPTDHVQEHKEAVQRLRRVQWREKRNERIRQNCKKSFAVQLFRYRVPKEGDLPSVQRTR